MLNVIIKIVVVVFLLFVFGFIVSIVVEYFNRHFFNIEKAAKLLVREKLTKRDNLELNNLLTNNNIPEELLDKAKQLLFYVSSVIGIQAGQFRLSDKIYEILRVYKYELDEVNQSKWYRAALDEYIEVYGQDIFEILEKQTDPEKWNDRWEEMEEKPQNEEEWISLITTMNIKDFVIFFAPLLP